MGTLQQTIKAPFSLSGKGLHTGAEVAVTVYPGEPNTGFRFRVNGADHPINPREADGAQHRTVLKIAGAEVHTVEHLLGGLWGMGVDNAVIEVTGGEVPGCDGSACNFADRVVAIGLLEQPAERTFFAPKATLSAFQGGASIMAFPTKDGSFRVTYVLDYPESPIAQGTVDLAVTPESMQAELAPCRTFVMKCHAEAMLKAGLGRGASTENTVVLDGERVVENVLRFEDEPARHKALDLIGDLATVGCRLGIHVVAYKSGHALNLELARLLREALLKMQHPRGVMDIRRIESILPHRYPFLLVDRVVEWEPRKRIRTYKNLTRNEDFFNGHFPGQPIMPGVLQVEALAQSGALMMLGEGEHAGQLAVLMGVDGVKYRRPVVPGDRLDMDVVLTRLKSRLGVVKARGSVDGEMAIECEIKFALVDPEQYT